MGAAPILYVVMTDASTKDNSEVAGTKVGPARADDGDAELLLDDGSVLKVHSALLAVGSSVLHDAVQLARKELGDLLRIPLPGTTLAEARALVQLLYSQRREHYAIQLGLGELMTLAHVCHSFAFEDLTAVIDMALTKQSGPAPDMVPIEPAGQTSLKSDNVVELYTQARCQQLPYFQGACPHFIGAHMVKLLGPWLQTHWGLSCKVQLLQSRLTQMPGGQRYLS